MARPHLEGLPAIKVIGVGGGGCNAINRMVEAGIAGVEFVGINTDEQVLALCQADTCVKIGSRVTNGRGAGMDPERGRSAAEESRDELKEIVKDAEMVFVTAGMGGGTGTGAAPVVAQVAHDLGALTVAVVTKPFSFEGSKRRQVAENGVSNLREEVDTLIVIPNDRLLQICEPGVSFEDSLLVADDILRQGIQGISELITVPGLINLDFADVRRVMKDAGQALMAIGSGKGENRAVDAAQAAISSPLLEVSIHGARGVVFNVTSNGSLGLHELNMAAQVIAEVVDPEAEIIFGTAKDPQIGDEVKITLIATGFAGADTREYSYSRRGAGSQEDEEYRRMRMEAAGNPDDTDLPTFLRRPVSVR